MSLQAQLHPYLRERLRDLRNHGYCILERQLIEEDASIWDGYAHDQFNEEVVRHFDGAPFLMDENAGGDLVIRKPRNDQEMLRAIVDVKNSMNQALNEAQFEEGGMLVRRAS